MSMVFLREARRLLPSGSALFPFKGLGKFLNFELRQGALDLVDVVKNPFVADF
jgi:hypothetical protein